MTIQDFGGRKFILAIFTILCAFLLAVANHITFADFEKIVILSFAIFSATNAFSKIGRNLNDK